MLEQSKDAITGLNIKHATLISGALTKKKTKGYKAPTKITGQTLYDALEKASTDMTTIITALAGESGDEVNTVIKTLTGKTINKKKAPAKGTGNGTPRSSGNARYADDQRIITHVVPNPKRGASRDRFAQYQVGMTVAEAIKAGVVGADIPWDTAPNRNLITLAPEDDKDALKLRDEYLKSQEKAA